MSIGILYIFDYGKFRGILDGIKNTVLVNKPVIIIEIQGGYSIEMAPPEIVEKILYTKSTLANLGYTLHRISGIDYLCIPNEIFYEKE